MPKSRGRTRGTREQKTNILIVCEGTTEELYIKKLKSKYRLTTVSITVKDSGGGSATKVAEAAKKEENYQKRNTVKRYEEVYCVFDNDNKNIDTEIYPALKEMINNEHVPIYSNMSFELWLAMHYDSYYPKAYGAPQSCENALKRLDSGYTKTGYNLDEYMQKIPVAKEKSLRMMDRNFEKPNTKLELEINPYTNMGLLIERLERESKK